MIQIHVKHVMFSIVTVPDVRIYDFNPRAKKHHDYELTFPEGTTHKWVEPTRLGHYGHDEYYLPNGDKITVTTEFQEKTAWFHPAKPEDKATPEQLFKDYMNSWPELLLARYVSIHNGPQQRADMMMLVLCMRAKQGYNRDSLLEYARHAAHFILDAETKSLEGEALLQEMVLKAYDLASDMPVLVMPPKGPDEQGDNHDLKQT